MPIVRTYACPECNHMMSVTLTMEESDKPPPSCPQCDRREMQQEFKPFAIGGSTYSKARALAEDIARNDYHVGDIELSPSRKKLRYKDESDNVRPSSWGAGGQPGGIVIDAKQSMETAINMGREIRQKFGSGLDVLQSNLKSGAQKDLIEVSKQRSPKIW